MKLYISVFLYHGHAVVKGDIDAALRVVSGLEIRACW